MGKAARNEAEKLTATYINNIAVALLVAGLAIPVISAVRMTDAETSAFSLLTSEGIQRLSAELIAALIATGMSLSLHAIARGILWRDIED
jgi:hypothetical protein